MSLLIWILAISLIYGGIALGIFLEDKLFHEVFSQIEMYLASKIGVKA